MRASNRPQSILTPTERAAEELRENEKYHNANAECFKCVNGCKVFELWVCESNLEWPWCKQYAGGYFVNENPVPRETL